MKNNNNTGPPFPARSSLGRSVLWIAFVALLYFFVARISLLFVFLPEGIAAIWPPSGIFLSAILLTRRDLRPWLAGALFITDFIAEILAGTPWMVSSIYALVLTGDAVFSSWLLLRFVSDPFTFRRIRELVGWLLLSVIFSNALASLVSAAAASRFLPGTSFGDSWKLWMASDGIGNLIVTPLVLSWAAWGSTRVGIRNLKSMFEGAMLFTLLALVNYLAFYRLSESGLSSLLLTYLTFPFLLWAAIRYGVRGVASGALILAAVSIFSTATGHVTHDLLQSSPLDVVITVQLYLAIMVVPALFLATVITERKQAEEALHESEDKFKHVFDDSSVGKSITLLSGEISVNRAFCKMLGYSPEELQRKKWREITHPDDIELTQREIDTLFSGEKAAVRFNKRYLKKDGSVIWTDLSSSVRRDQAGKPLYFMTTLVDITERKRVEELQKETEHAKSELLEKLNEAQHIATIGSWEWNLQTNQVWWSDETYRIFGVTPQDFVPSFEANGKFIHPDDFAKYNQSFEHSFQTGEPLDLEARLVANDGLLKHFHAKGKIVYDDTDQPIRFIGSILDISERKQAEKALRESEERWRSLVNATPDYIALHDEEGRFLFLNHYAEGFNENDVIGSSLYQYLLPESLEIFRSSMEKALNTWTIQYFEYAALGNRGARRMYENYLVPLRDQNQEINVLAVARDITERKRVEDALQEYNTRLEAEVNERTRELREAHEQLVRQEKLAVLGQLAGGVGHELRNPLAVINNAIYFLKLVQPDANEKVKEYLGMIDKETHNAEKIINDLLDFARVKSVDCEQVSIPELVQRVLERYPAPASVTVTLDFPPGLPEVYADPRQVEQVLGNLVVNACQAMPEGGRLTIAARCEDKDIVIAITDTGVGVSPEKLKKLFEPLFTTKAKGIGLGLAVSKKLAEANGGRIEVTSEEGKGSVFTVYLPVHKDIE